MSLTRYEAGSHIESVCGKCKQTTNHLVVAMVGELVAKVQCNICGSAHKHRSAKPAKSRAASAKSSTAGKSAPRQSAAMKKYQEALAGSEDQSLKTYSMQEPFKVGDRVQHPTFGLGVVQTVTKPNKMEVLFEGGIKLLRCTL